jgi:hypothetical protein
MFGWIRQRQKVADEPKSITAEMLRAKKKALDDGVSLMNDVLAEGDEREKATLYGKSLMRELVRRFWEDTMRP